jgi:pSer/pThr/pTyr-binding forkhead associated (FHA) protein
VTDSVLDLLKFGLLALLYLFFARVLWAVWSEVRAPRIPAQGRVAAGAPVAGGHHATATATAPAPARSSGRRPAKGKRGRPGRLVVLEPKARRGTAFPLEGEFLIGRDPACVIRIDDDSYVSTLHARVFDHEGQPMLEDLGSTNGTFHNGTKMSGVKLLHPGDRIQIGYTVLEAQ